MPRKPYNVLIAQAAKRQLMRFGTLKDVGERLGMQPAYMTKWTNGIRLENVNHLAEMVETVGGNPDAMFADLVELDLGPEEAWMLEVLRAADLTTRQRIVEVVGAMSKSPNVPVAEPHREEALRLLARAPMPEVRIILVLLEAMGHERNGGT